MYYYFLLFYVSLLEKKNTKRRRENAYSTFFYNNVSMSDFANGNYQIRVCNMILNGSIHSISSTPCRVEAENFTMVEITCNIAVFLRCSRNLLEKILLHWQPDRPGSVWKMHSI